MGAAGYKPRFGKDIRIKPDEIVRPPALRRCARPECENEGTHKVPKSRDRLNEHLWFCLEHARAHNESWDFFAGMNESQIEAFRVEALTGHRPTWPLGKRSARAPQSYHFTTETVSDEYSVFGDVAEKEKPRAPERRLTRPQLQALDVLNLEATASLHEIKARYKELVKRFHPDANGGDRGAEERLKQVIKAYGVLRAAGLT
jgi:DnaJ-domain-containing protein 1